MSLGTDSSSSKPIYETLVVEEDRANRRVSLENYSKQTLAILASIAILILAGTISVMISFSSRIYLNPRVIVLLFSDLRFDPGEVFDEGFWSVWPMIYGTFAVGLPALLFSLIWGLGTAIFLSEYTSDKWSRRIQAVVEFFAGMPSIVLGLIAVRYISQVTKLIFQQPWFLNLTQYLGFNDGRGINVSSSNIILNASLAVAVMATPIIASISLDAMKSTPSPQRDAVKSLGGTRREVFQAVVFPHSKKTIYASVLLAFGRIIGETMIVTVVVGANPFIGLEWLGRIIPIPNLFVNGITMTSVITIYFGEASAQSDIRQLLFFVGALLLLMSFFIVWISNLIADENPTMMRLIDLLYTPVEFFSQKISDFRQRFVDKQNINEDLTLLFINKRNRQDLIFQSTNGFILLFYLSWSFFLIFQMTEEGFEFLGRNTNLFGAIANFFQFIITIPVLSVIDRGDYGAYPALIGSASLVFTGALLSFPISTATGIYLYEFARENRYSKIIQQAIINISAIPSIVIGLFVYAAFTVGLDMGKGLLPGAIALGIMMIPIVTTNTIEALRNIPEEHKQSALALGATRWEAFKKHRFPYAFPSIITGYILGIARVIGETAPILFTAAAITNVVFPTDLTHQAIRALPYEIFYNLALEPRIGSDGYRIGPVWASAMAIVLLFFVAILNFMAFWIRKQLRKRYEYNGNI